MNCGMTAQMRFGLEIEPLDLDQTLGCGQTFRWKLGEDGSWTGPLGDQLITLRKEGASLVVHAVPGGPRVRELVETHLRKGDDIDNIARTLRRDPVLTRGLGQYRGLRIVKMDEWECLCSFALATYANIPRISKMIEALATRFGDRIVKGAHAFPDLGSIRKASVAELSRCGLGYRAGYIHAMSRVLDEGHLDGLRRLGYEDLRNGLIELPGVGEKVADCVSLFGFGKLEAFPIDVWMRRALERLYGQRGSYRTLRAFASARFGKYSGYAQEYLYLNERMYAGKAACAFSGELTSRRCPDACADRSP